MGKQTQMNTIQLHKSVKLNSKLPKTENGSKLKNI